MLLSITELEGGMSEAYGRFSFWAAAEAAIFFRAVRMKTDGVSQKKLLSFSLSFFHLLASSVGNTKKISSCTINGNGAEYTKYKVQ